MKRVLVTGATGFIGRQTLPFLVKLGYEVHAIYRGKKINSENKVIWHENDLLDQESVNTLVAKVKPTHLLHFAWYVDPKDYKTSPENERWRIATDNILKAFQENGGVRAVLAGSAMEYDPSLTDEKIKESAATKEHNAYASAKILTHAASEIFAKANNVSLAWGRVFNLYGPYEARERLVSQVILSLLSQKSPSISTGGLVLDYSYVKDTAGAFVALLDSNVTGTVNIASGTPISLKQMAFAIAEILEQTDLLRDLNDIQPSNGPARVVADIQRLREEVKWHSRFTLEQGLRETIEWWRADVDSTPIA